MSLTDGCIWESITRVMWEGCKPDKVKLENYLWNEKAKF